MKMIYLDHNASTPVDPEVADVMDSTIRSNYGNPSSTHAAGTMARQALETARAQVAQLIGASPDEIFFTSGGTESNNLAIIGTAFHKGRGHIITSVIEHPSVINPCRHLEKLGFEVSYAGVDRTGQVRVEEIKTYLRAETFLVTVMQANNETGVLQPVEDIGLLCRERGISFHTDAAQTIGKIPVQAEALTADMVTIVSHKFYGPKGVGALYARKGLSLHPILFGAGHEKGLRPGTENIPGIAGLGKACELARFSVDERATRAKRLTAMLCAGLMEKVGGVRLNGHETLRLPNTVNVSISGIDSIDLLDAVKDKVAASPGSACHAGVRRPSAVLKAMGLSDNDALSAIRLSVGKDNTEEEMVAAINILAEAVDSMRQR